MQAYEQAKISEGQLARFLHCDPVTAREVVADCLKSLEVGEDGETRTVEMDFQRSLLQQAS